MATLVEFDYEEPSTLAEAFSILARNDGAKILAGGTDLLVSMRERKIRPKLVVNIKKIPGLDGIGVGEEDGLRLGALVTIGAIESSALVCNAFPMVADAAHQLGSFQVRNRATLGGNLCNSSPAADMAPPLIALGAVAKIARPTGERQILLEDFFSGPGKTVLSTGEILTEVQVPNPPRGSHGAFVKHGPRVAMDIATVSAAALVTQKGQICVDAKIVLGAVAPVPMRARRAESEIRGKKIDDDLIRRVGDIASSECRPISDVRGSAEYRKAIVEVLVRRLFGKILDSRMPRKRGSRL